MGRGRQRALLSPAPYHWGTRLAGAVNEDLVPVSDISSEGQREGRGWGKMLESF